MTSPSLTVIEVMDNTVQVVVAPAVPSLELCLPSIVPAAESSAKRIWIFALDLFNAGKLEVIPWNVSRPVSVMRNCSV